jgi:thiol-disulfide isomerase/thioredoxin
MTGVWIALAALALALAFGGYRRLTDGRARAVSEADAPRLDPVRLGDDLGREATFVQFSATVCAPCRATHRVLSEVVAERPGIAHIDLNAETRLDLVEEFGVLRTPTVLLLDGDGVVRHRIVGAARKDEVLDALEQLADRPAA